MIKSNFDGWERILVPWSKDKASERVGKKVKVGLIADLSVLEQL
jgi:hypothetical protein